MTKRDYVLIAEVLVSLGKDAAHCFDSEADRKAIAARFAGMLAATNERFDRDRFIKAATAI